MKTMKAGPNLTYMTSIGRKVVKFGGIGLIVLMFGRMALSAFIAYWEATHPDPPPPPTVGFNVLPAINFPPQTPTDKPSQYVLELPNGILPEFGDRAKVFFMPKSTVGLLTDQRAQQVASDYGFSTQPERLTTTRYRWNKDTPLLTTFDLDIDTFHFEYRTDFLARPELLLATNLPSRFDAAERTKDFLSESGLLPSDVATSSAQILYKRAVAGELDDAVSVSDADFISVDITRGSIDGDKAMYTPEGTKGTIHGIVTSAVSDMGGVVLLEFKHFPVDYTQMHTYPLRSTQTAWEILQKGEGYVADKGTADIATIRSVELGYYDSFEYQPYLRPIYVFKGDGGFLGYVSAISPEFISQTVME